MKLSNAFTDRLQIKYPIIQAPMLGVSTPEMAAAVSNEGGLGSLAVGGLSPDTTRTLIRKTKSLTNKPFAVNLFAHDIPPYKDSDLEPMREFITKLAMKRGYQLNASDLTNFTLYTYSSQISVLIKEKVNIISFTFGCPDPNSIKTFKDNGCLLIGTATCLQEALILQDQQVDMIIAQGIEAGGHRGTFVDNIPLPHVGLISLLSQMNERIKVPCIAAGGINNGRSIKAALDLGAVAAQIGTAFINSNESDAILSYKQRITQSIDTDSSLTRAFSGRWARGIRNTLMNEIENAKILIPPYPLQNSLTSKLRKLAQQNNDSEYTNLWSGQSCRPQQFTTTRDILLDLVNQCVELNS
ncbi:MAG TPA: nitronate monooxygenase [Cyclobacteriaceae bacterium]